MEERQRRSFTEEYKRQALELVVSSRRSISSVVKELSLRNSVLLRKSRRRRRGARPHSRRRRRRTRIRRPLGCAGERTAAHGAPHFNNL